MDRVEFEKAVADSVANLPEEFKDRMENITVMVEDYPSRYQLAKVGAKPGHTLLGLYEGVPLTKRTNNYGLVAPDKVTIFQKPVEMVSRSNGTDIREEITKVVKHEIGHYFGISDARLEEIEREKHR